MTRTKKRRPKIKNISEFQKREKQLDYLCFSNFVPLILTEYRFEANNPEKLSIGISKTFLFTFTDLIFNSMDQNKNLLSVIIFKNDNLKKATENMHSDFFWYDICRCIKHRIKFTKEIWKLFSTFCKKPIMNYYDLSEIFAVYLNLCMFFKIHDIDEFINFKKFLTYVAMPLKNRISSNINQSVQFLTQILPAIQLGLYSGFKCQNTKSMLALRKKFVKTNNLLLFNY